MNIGSKTDESVKIPSRPTYRKPFENPGRLKFPEIPGYTIGVFSIDDPSCPREIEIKKQEHWVEVRAEEIGYDKSAVNSQEKGSFVYVNMGRNVKGLVMKKPTRWLELDETDARKHSESLLERKAQKPESSSDKNLTMTDGQLNISHLSNNK